MLPVNKADFTPAKQQDNVFLQGVQVRKDKKDLVSIAESIVKLCSEFKVLKQPKFLESTSTSESSQLLGSLQNQNVFLKLFTQNSITTNGPIVEGAIYSYVISKLIPKYCPFFIKPIAYQECDGFMNRLVKKFYDQNDKDDKNLIQEIIRKLNPRRIGKEPITEKEKDVLFKIHTQQERTYIIINEQLQPSDVTLKNWLLEVHSLSSYQSVYFEIFWALACMSAVNLRHNDLHLTNIYVRKLEKETVFPFTFNYNKKAFNVYLKTRYKVLIYDFDRGTIVDLTDNTYLQSLCDQGYGCQTSNFGYDLTRMICYSVTAIVYLYDALKKQVSLKTLNKQQEEINILYMNEILLTYNFLAQFLKIQDKDLADFQTSLAGTGAFCAYPPKDEFLKELIRQKFPSDFQELKFIGAELFYDFNFIKTLAEDPFFESVRSVQFTDIKGVDYDTNSGVIYSIPDKKVNKEIQEAIKQNFPQILYRPPLSLVLL